jgi:hypothetical protein
MKKAKNKELSFRQLAKSKTKSVKDKNTFANTFYCCYYKGYIVNNNLLDIDSKSLNSSLLKLNKDKVEEVAAYS